MEVALSHILLHPQEGRQDGVVRKLPRYLARVTAGKVLSLECLPEESAPPKNLVSPDGFGSPVPRQPVHLHTQAESGVSLRDPSRVPGRRTFIYFKPPCAIGSAPRLSGHAMAYRWRSLPRVRRHRISKPQGSSKRTNASLAGYHGPITMRLSFPHPLFV